MSAREALARAKSRESAAPAEPASPSPAPAPRAASPSPALARRAAPSASPPPAARRKRRTKKKGRRTEVHELIHGLVPDAQIQRTIPIGNRVVFKALWTAHRTRARADGDLPLVLAADALLAASTLPKGLFFAASVQAGEHTWAVFVDLDAQRVLAAVPRPEVYLAGVV